MNNKPLDYQIEQYRHQETLRKAEMYRLTHRPRSTRRGWLAGLFGTLR